MGETELLTLFVTDALTLVTIFEQTHEDNVLLLLTETAAFVLFDDIITAEAHFHIGEKPPDSLAQRWQHSKDS